MLLEFDIKVGTIEDCLVISRQLPEFADSYYQETDYRQRLLNVPSLILVAYTEASPIGFKVGYQRDADGSFYSWMGGVLPQYRKQKIAKSLAVTQQIWAKQHNYNAITFKTRNNLKPMLIFALQDGFDIIEVIQKETISENRILLRKSLGLTAKISP